MGVFIAPPNVRSQPFIMHFLCCWQANPRGRFPLLKIKCSPLWPPVNSLFGHDKSTLRADCLICITISYEMSRAFWTLIMSQSVT